MADEAQTVHVSSLEHFALDRVLGEDPLGGHIDLLGTLDGHRAIVTLTKTAFDVGRASELVSSFARIQALGENDAYHWFLAWFGADKADAHAKVNVICPATDVHVRKHTQQPLTLVRETPALYRAVVEPYIRSFDVSRVQWVYNILDYVTERERIVYDDTDPLTGFIIVPDLKWDQKTVSALYVQAIVRDRSLRSLRDLRPSHLPLLRKLDGDGRRAVAARYGLRADEIRAFVHYQPSYYHLHVHMLHVGLRGYGGCTTGQSHLLADLIDALELEAEGPPASPPYMLRRTFTYALGSEHGLFAGLTAASTHS